MEIKGVVEKYVSQEAASSVNTKEKSIVSARITAPQNARLENLAKQFGIKKSSLAAELLEAAIDEAWLVINSPELS